MTLHRKIGGIHWLRLGRLRIAFCIVKAKPKYRHGYRIYDIPDPQPLKTYTSDERNIFGGFQ